ncbi:choice-of-anchor B family protein [Candidatus Palauibacter sp.]|uniref:choice-of-anchor B family protein n=1 Tax=Candidatus Palauibacter sp. TaxID=3101350 RepID=UPI003B017C1F
MNGRVLPVVAGLALALPVGVGAQQFGGALAVSGDQVLVGEAGNGTMSGIVWIFGRTADGWAETGQIMVAEEVRAPDGFGRAIAASDEWLWAGAPLEADGAGAVYVFRADGAGGWERVARFEAPEGARAFGSAIALSDDAAIVSAPGADGGRGAVFPYVRSPEGAFFAAEAVRPSDDVAASGFGAALALDGGTLLVSSREDQGNPSDVFAFVRDDSGGWTISGSLETPSLPERSGFGATLAVRDGFALVGAPTLRESGGGVFAFARGPDGWGLEARLGPLLPEPNAQFGSSIHFDGPRILIGAPGSSLGAGVTYAYRRDAEGRWSAASILTRSPLGDGSSFASSVAVSGDHLVVGATGVDSRAGAAVVYERSGDGWEEAGTLLNDYRGFPALAGEEIECVEGQADVFECRDVNITAFMPIKDIGGTRGTRVNDLWGWTDPETGREIAIVGRTNGTSFVDVSDPYHPRYLGDLPATEGSRHMIWRDIKVYRDHAYIVADAALEHGVQVFDLRQLREVGDEPVTFEETYLYDGIHSAHNIVINEETGFAYAVGNSGGGETCGGGLHMIDLEEPGHPVFAGCFAQEGTGRRGTGYVHDAQCVIYRGPDSEHAGKEICLGSNELQFNIVDVSDKDAPVSIATLDYANVAYAHQGWLTEDHRYFYMNDEGDEPRGLVPGTRTLVWDVRDLDDPILATEYIAETTATDHNLYIVGDLMYQSNYSAGFRVLDISDPENPVEIGFFDTSPYEGGASWSNYPYFASGTIAVTGTGDGLFLLKNMARPRLVP